MADNVNDSLKDLGKLIEDADKKVKQLDSDYKQGVNGAIVLLDSVKSKIAEVNNVGIKKLINAKDIEEEAKKIPTVFSHVIDDINKKAQRSGDEFSKKLTNADSVRSEAQRAFASIKEEYEKATKGMTPMGAVALANRGGVDTSILSSAARKRYEKQIQSEAARLQLGPSQITPELIRRQEVAQQNLNKALQQFAELQNQANAAQNAFAAKSMAVQALADKYANIDKQIENLRQKFAELYVKKDAGLIDDKKFTTQSNAIINKYNELVAKRDEFEKGTNIATQSYERERKRIEEENRLAAIRRENANSRQRDEVNAERMIAQARAERARKEAQADASMKKSVSQQVTNYKQLSALLKQYNSLKQVKGRTQEENAALEQTRAKIKEIIAAMRELDSKQSGSLGKARDITAYDRILEKDKEITRERQKQNRLTNQQKSSLESMLPTIRRLASAFGVAFSVQGLVQFGKKLVETRGEFELQQVALRSILQNKQLADEIWDKTMQAALQSPFTAMQLTRYTKQLAAYRIETDKLFDTTKRLADVSAGLGVDMQRLVLAYGQVKAANYLRASEIRQFTEAGVNILGELTSYFNETRDGMYNTAKVMDMVQKRMVKFEDVEAIFKRMTDEGGIFFNMQYIQSQTVKGQINKLRDAYDQMLNSIGKANEGPIKNMVSLLLNIVKNWREWKTVLDSILWPTLTIAVIKFSRGLLMVDASAKIASKSLHGLTLAGAKVNRGLSTILNTLKKFPVGGIWGALGLGVAFVGVTALINHANAVAAINKEYDEQKNRIRETARSLEDYQRRVNENNETIKNRTKIAKDDKEAQDKLKKAQQDNKTIVNKLTSDYPEFAKSIKLASDKQADLGTIVEETNARLRDQVALLEASKAGFGFDDLKTNIEEFQGATLTQEEQVRNNLDIAQNLYQDFLDWKENEEAKAREKYEGNERRLQKRLKEIRETEPPSWITDIINAGTDTEAQTKAIQGIKNLAAGFISYSRGIELKKLIKIPTGQTDGPLSTLQKTQEEREKDLRESLQRLGTRVRIMYRAELEKLNNGAIEDAKKYVAENGTIVDAWFKFGEGEGWKYLNERVVSLSNALGVSIDEARKIVEEEVNKVLMSAYGKTIKLDWSKVETGSTDQETPEEKQAKIDAAWRRRINLLEEMKKRYDELSKSAYGYAKSNTTVRTEFEKSWGKIFGGVLSMNAVQFTSAAEMETAFETILAKAGAASDAVKEEIQKKADSYGARIPIDVQVRIREDFGRQMEEAFGNYELTLELQGLNIPPDMAKDLFPDLDMTTLGELQDIMDDFYQRQKKTDKDGNTYFDKDDLEQYRKWADKIDAEILKSRKEKVKQYGKFLEQEYSERAKLEMQHAKDVAFVTANVSDEGKRDNIIKNINEKFEKDLNELNWKSFKESAFYVEMMDDLSSIPMEYMRLMLGKIEEILQHPETLSPRALKEAINARQKIIEAQMDFDQIAVMRDSMKEIREAAKSPEEGGVGGDTWRQTKRNLDKEQKAQAEKLANIEKEIEKDKELQGQVKVLEDAQLAVANASKALGKAVVTDLENAASEGGDATSVLNRYKNELEELRGEVSLFTQKQQNIGKKDEEGNIISITQTEKDINAGNEKRIEDLQRFIPLLETYIRLLGEQFDIENKLGEGVAAQGAGMTSTSIGQGIQGKQNKADKITERLTVIKRWQKAFVNFNNAFAKFNQNAVDMVNRIGALGSAAYDTFEALGGETDALTEGWKEFGNTVVSVITEALTMIPTLVAGFIGAGTAINAAMGIIGLIAEAIQLVIALIGALAKLHDAGYEKEIENQQKIIDNLQRAYERLEKAIEKTWATASYLRTYNEETQNLYEQIEALNKQLAAEEAKKNTDKDKLQDYKDKIQEAYDELENLKQSQIEVFGGIGEVGYRSAAEGFVDAWKSAFLETGDGLQGLQDHFDEFLQDWFVKQATMRIAGNMLEPVFRQIDRAVDEYGTGGTSAMLSEIQNVREMAAAIFPDLSLALEDLAGMFGVGGEGSLSGLAAGIQGMTEEQANILEAYWNSVRMYTASIDMNVSRIAEMLGAGGAESNPMLQQMSLIAANVQATHQLLQSVTKSGHSQGGYGIKVFND